MLARLLIILLLLPSLCWAGPSARRFTSALKCTPPTTLHGSSSITASGNWPTGLSGNMGTCVIPVTITVKGSGGGGGQNFGQHDGSLGANTTVSRSGWSMTANGGAGGDSDNPYAVAVAGSQSYTGAVSAITQTDGAGNFGGEPDDELLAAPGARGGYIKGTVTGNFTVANPIAITIGGGGYATSVATDGQPGSVLIEW